jgi:hypothetical protein
MKNLTKIVLVALAAIGLVLAVAVLRPPRARAQPTTVNPTSPRTPWTGSCTMTPISTTAAAAQCTITDVPTDAELVVESEVYNAVTTGASTVEVIDCQGTSAGVAGTALWMATGTSTPNPVYGGYELRFSTAIPFYVDAGSSIQCGVDVRHHSDFVSQIITLNGWYVAPT